MKIRQKNIHDILKKFRYAIDVLKDVDEMLLDFPYLGPDEKSWLQKKDEDISDEVDANLELLSELKKILIATATTIEIQIKNSK